MSTSSTPQVQVTKHFSSFILLWMRNDQPRQKGMDHWKGPHSGIISASPGQDEYRQIHLAETNPGRWPETAGLETRIPEDRRIDGIAEVTFQSPLSVLKGRKQTQLAFKDEINVFRRSLLHAGAPGTSRWYEVGDPTEPVPSRAVVFLRRREGVSSRQFRRVVRDELVPALVGTGVLRELRTQSFMPWHRLTWNTPDVAHDNPSDQHLHASLVLGFTDDEARAEFLEGEAARKLGQVLTPVVSAVHAYDVSATLTYVKDGIILPRRREEPESSLP